MKYLGNESESVFKFNHELQLILILSSYFKTYSAFLTDEI